jgi:ubiquinone/menaquinone biosynthesis C-methylase UbiE
MNSSSILPQAALGFDRLAEGYDRVFTDSVIGRAQRNVVWQALAEAFAPGSHILEMNCGTGEDAIFLSRKGISVFACDASQRMVEVARSRVLSEDQDLVQLELLPIEQLFLLQPQHPFDGAFSNFSGLNCVADLHETARQLSMLLAPGASLIICLSTRFCAFEMIWFLLRGDLKNAFRRTSGQATAHVSGLPVSLQYFTVGQLRELFSPWFKLRSFAGVGVVIPPTFAESWISKHPLIFKLLEAVDRKIHRLPGLRVLGDHILLSFERVLQ